MELLLERLLLVQFLQVDPPLSQLEFVLFPFLDLVNLLQADRHQLEREARGDEHTQQREGGRSHQQSAEDQPGSSSAHEDPKPRPVKESEDLSQSFAPANADADPAQPASD